MKNKKLLNPVLAALFAAVLAVISQIMIPTPFGVPITLQTFAVALCGYMLGSWWSLTAVSVWLSVGFIGLPVFSGFSAGASALLGLTGGFLWGFLIFVFLCGIASKKNKKSIKFAISLIGLVICHLMGIIQFSFVSDTGFFAAFITVSLPYILKDILLVLAALVLEERLFKIKSRFIL